MTGTEADLFAALGGRGQTFTLRDTGAGSEITME